MFYAYSCTALRNNFSWKDKRTSFAFGLYLTDTCINNLCFDVLILVTQQMQLVVDLTTTFSSRGHTVCLQHLKRALPFLLNQVSKE